MSDDMVTGVIPTLTYFEWLVLTASLTTPAAWLLLVLSSGENGPVKLSGPDFFEWMGVRRGGLARWEDRYYDHGNPVPGWLIPDIVDGLLKDGLLELGDPDESGMRPVTLTETGLTHYRVLCKRQRRKDRVAP